ncbi:hypothetical protein Bbelb_149270 [Branchiostoma belcheri]|nr:hypothetical protein Bbelb_149270 [Branchiostoma belcheri]
MIPDPLTLHSFCPVSGHFGTWTLRHLDTSAPSRAVRHLAQNGSVPCPGRFGTWPRMNSVASGRLRPTTPPVSTSNRCQRETGALLSDSLSTACWLIVSSQEAGASRPPAVCTRERQKWIVDRSFVRTDRERASRLTTLHTDIRKGSSAATTTLL